MSNFQPFLFIYQTSNINNRILIQSIMPMCCFYFSPLVPCLHQRWTAQCDLFTDRQKSSSDWVPRFFTIAPKPGERWSSTGGCPEGRTSFASSACTRTCITGRNACWSSWSGRNETAQTRYYTFIHVGLTGCVWQHGGRRAVQPNPGKGRPGVHWERWELRAP